MAAVLLNQFGFQNLVHEVKNAPTETPAWSMMLLENRGLLPYLPVPGLILSLLALMMRPLRGLLAMLAMFATILSVLVIVATLLAGIVPLYQLPNDMGFGGT